MDQRAWIAAGRRFGQLGRVSNWWIGDWLRYGKAKWGQKYVTATRITGYDVHSLENMVCVASRIESSLRRENLSWSHHALVASLERAAQEHWLNLASARHLSVADLRIELRAADRSVRASAGSKDSTAASKKDPQIGNDAMHLVCPNCGEVVPLDPDRVGLLDISDRPH